MRFNPKTLHEYYINPFHYSDDIWASWRLKSPAIRLFVCKFLQANIKETSKPAPLALCENPPVTGQFPWQRSTNVESVSIQWCIMLYPFLMPSGANQWRSPHSEVGPGARTWRTMAESVRSHFSARLAPGTSTSAEVTDTSAADFPHSKCPPGYRYLRIGHRYYFGWRKHVNMSLWMPIMSDWFHEMARGFESGSPVSQETSSATYTAEWRPAR